MEVRLSRLPSDIEEWMDGANDAAEITATAHWACKLYGDPDVLKGIVGRFLVHRARGTRAETADLLEAYGLDLAGRCQPQRRGALVIAGVIGMLRSIERNAEWYAASNFEDSTKGGCMLPFRRHHRLDSQDRPTKRLRRRLYSRKAIRRYVKLMPETAMMRRRTAAVLALGYERDYAEHFERIGEDFSRQSQYQRLASERATQAAFLDVSKVLVRVRKTAIADRDRRRKVSARAALSACAILGREHVARFIRGDQVVIVGKKVAFGVERGASVLAEGHGVLCISIYDLSGDKLACLCLYQEKICALDQLSALALHVKAGNEDHLLETGNFYNLQPAAIGHHALAGHQKEIDTAPPIVMDDRRRFNLRVLEYERDCEPLYREELHVQIFGRRANEPDFRFDTRIADHILIQ